MICKMYFAGKSFEVSTTDLRNSSYNRQSSTQMLGNHALSSSSSSENQCLCSTELLEFGKVFGTILFLTSNVLNRSCCPKQYESGNHTDETFLQEHFRHEERRTWLDRHTESQWTSPVF